MLTSAIQTERPERGALIAQARRQWIEGDDGAGRLPAPIEPWITRSWQRCLGAGRRPHDSVDFDPVSRARLREVRDRNHRLVEAAQPVMAHLSRTLADTRYFPILTDAQGLVVDVGTLPDLTQSDERRALDLARVGVDLSESRVGTTAIGAALAEQQPVWLHRGEHFFDVTSVYSCAGAPLFGPQGECVGMLDLTGVNEQERPELVHLAAMSARSIENALVQQHRCALLLHLAWPGYSVGPEAMGLVALDAEGHVTGTNACARQMLHRPLLREPGPLHASDLFAVPLNMLFDAARRDDVAIEVPLWSGLRVRARVQRGGRAVTDDGEQAARPSLREVEGEMIRRAVDDAMGNVAEAARALGISRATVYRKLWQARRQPPG
ncbi:helix-turn-helix domain-containing protein [Variovorax dokdonensis]|uniref:Helix-turn-helix domain-containing protein n=1 Tax=Variovorax dokdonensis TaxID=344883 RepID=A0ABT7NC11_9BURK|nr:helix-turn-helix domain-containing protein [Variovorax dokdonensis]MDM0045482.1 helix-turn-helix domain-containing protein [Variovorax dokdonensis]